ncbi:S41 family peptidase [Taibaiella koreensis]|uniref:S41 family peptidase n=1 Tax=Taibaiella koreensis TaxID=1268548 RepID=UPI001968FFC7|nr:S41 family peptidase [Taibaiella koreensis]
MVVDQKIRQEGSVSLSITKAGGEGDYAGISCTIAPLYEGDTLTLTGYLRSENVSGGDARLWMRVDNKGGAREFDDMSGRGVTGNTGWTQYEIRLPYNSRKAVAINLGAELTGSGKMWVDHLQLYLDKRLIENAPLKRVLKAEIWQDTTAFQMSGITNIPTDRKHVRLLTQLGMLWGFLKYYHPAIAEGNFNWDSELFKVLPGILRAPDAAAAYKIMEQWVDGLGPVASCNDCIGKAAATLKVDADYGYLFMPGCFPASLVRKLAFIRDNHIVASKHYYVDQGDYVNNPVFTHEVNYLAEPCPDAGLRLLSLYRYWSIIQYFFPNRHLIGKDWNAVLADEIRTFAQSSDLGSYTLACLKLIARIHDTHANIWGKNPTLDSLKGKMILPIRTTFVENKLVVIGYYGDADGVKQQVAVGDIVEKIDGVPVARLVQKYLPYTAASNFGTQLFAMSAGGGFLLRSNDSTAILSLQGKQERRKVKVMRLPYSEAIRAQDRPQYRVKTSHELLRPDIGYIFPAQLRSTSIDTIRKALGQTKGIVIDLRSYPTAPMAYNYGAWLKPSASVFAKFTGVDFAHPGAFLYGDSTANGGDDKETYKGRIAILVNSYTQSQAEFTTMALSTVPGAAVIGETSAGADGNVSEIRLPGGIFTLISGIGVLYPDGTESQRLGVKIDIPVHPTIGGIRAGRDELLERALSYIDDGR